MASAPFDGFVHQPLQLVFFHDHGIDAHAGLELDFVDGVQVGGVGHAQEQALAAAEHGQHTVLGQQLVRNQPGDFEVNRQGVEVEERYAEFARGCLSDGARLGDTGTYSWVTKWDFLFLGGGEGRNSVFLADDSVLDEPLRQAGEPAAVANIGY